MGVFLLKGDMGEELGGTNDLAVEVVFLDHDDVDCLGVLEGQEAEAAGATGGAISHDCALDNFAELREVISEGLWGIVSTVILTSV
jgi:hypothetical protein